MTQKIKTLIPTELLEYPMQVAAANLFVAKSKNCLLNLMIDYYPRDLDIRSLNNKTTGTVVTAMQSIMLKWGIAETVYMY